MVMHIMCMCVCKLPSGSHVDVLNQEFAISESWLQGRHRLLSRELRPHIETFVYFIIVVICAEAICFNIKTSVDLKKLKTII